MMRGRTFCAVCAVFIMLLPGYPAAGEEFPMARIDIKQEAIPETEAFQFTRGMKAGWNLGNTFDAVDCAWLSDGLLYEMAWSGAMTQPRLFDALKEAGFGAVRIPVSWHNHVSGETFTIDPAWLARVKEVVDDALKSGLSVIVNIHHDVDTAYLYPDDAHLDNSKRYVTAIWGQLAEAFRDYGDALIFESMNEPRLKGTEIEWWLNPKDKKSAEAVRCINALNQAFVDTVRASGGNNATRYLLVPGYGASADGALHQAFELPADSAADRLIVSVHAYTPYAFALQDGAQPGSKSTFDAGNAKDRAEIDSLMRKLYDRFIANGVPVVIGEYGARDKGGNLQARAAFTAYYVAAASAHGIPCFYWDNHAFAGTGELFGLLNRTTFTFAYPEILESIMANAMRVTESYKTSAFVIDTKTGFRYTCACALGAWCNGNTWVSKTFVEGSSPSAPARRRRELR